MDTKNVKDYYSALQEEFRVHSEVLTNVLPHSGERGRNNEEKFRDFLTKVLPKQFSVGTGFVISSQPNLPISSQTDVVLYDEFWNSPIYRELSSHVYPVEMVYGTVEVKRWLRKGDLDKICKDISKLQCLGHRKYYIEYVPVPKSNTQPEALLAGKQERLVNLKPRAFIFAYAQEGWDHPEQLVTSLREAANETLPMIHGIVVLKSDWYLVQEPYSKNGPQFVYSEGNALLKFTNGLLHSIGSMKMRPMSIDRYLQG
jgi:hypothetical protein